MPHENEYKVHNLISNLPNKTKYRDLNLVNSWGLVISEKTLWVADNVTGVLTHYNFKGEKLPPETVIIPNPVNLEPSSPTGLVINHTQSFVIRQFINENLTARSASFLIIVTEQGVICGY